MAFIYLIYSWDHIVKWSNVIMLPYLSIYEKTHHVALLLCIIDWALDFDRLSVCAFIILKNFFCGRLWYIFILMFWIKIIYFFLFFSWEKKKNGCVCVSSPTGSPLSCLSGDTSLLSTVTCHEGSEGPLLWAFSPTALVSVSDTSQAFKSFWWRF